MSPYALSFLLASATLSVGVLAQGDTGLPATPLASKHFAYPSGIPYQVDTDSQLIRGPQQGYNLCNSTTENQDSLCQTSFVNHIDDFCLWAPMKPNSTIADTEGEEVAWCTKPGRGTRLIPNGALKGVQYMRTPDYVQVVGFIDQQFININSDDFGGELDPHGADLRGNPLGGLMYSNAFPSNNGDNTTFQQVIEWHNFMGGNSFCIKVCDPAGANAANFCQHIYDRIGCAYNAPNNAQNGTFEACQGDNQDFPGIYTSGGQTLTYTQPAESLGPITSIPFTPRVPASSNCVQFKSADLFASLPSPTNLPKTTSTSSTKGGSNGSSTRTGSSSGAANTANSAVGSVMRARGSESSVTGVMMGLVTGTFGVAFAMAFLA